MAIGPHEYDTLINPLDLAGLLGDGAREKAKVLAKARQQEASIRQQIAVLLETAVYGHVGKQRRAQLATLAEEKKAAWLEINRARAEWKAAVKQAIKIHRQL